MSFTEDGDYLKNFARTLLTCIMRISSKCLRTLMSCSACVFLYVMGIYEAAVGILQLSEILPSHNPMFILTGTFDNPGPFGGFMAVVTSVALAEFLETRNQANGTAFIKVRKISSLTALLFCILVLPASFSRAGWLALIVAVSVCLVRDERIKSWLKERKWLAAMAVVVLLLFCAGAFFLKKDSAIGRFHIWGIELRAIVHNPLTGTGPGSFMHTYGLEQARFFQNGDCSMTRIRVAGCPEYPFNEFLGIGVEYGAVTMILALAIAIVGIVLLMRKSSNLVYGLICWAVFACFSYPLSTELLRLTLAVLLFVAYFPTPPRFLSNLVLFVCSGTLTFLLLISEPLSRPAFRTLFQEGYELYEDGKYLESIDILTKGSSISCDPMFHVILGRDYEALGEYGQAEEEYILAHYMVPCRLYPLVRLMRLYINQGRDDEAIAVGESITQMEVRDDHAPMEKLMQEASAALDSLRLLKQQ